MNRPKTLAYFRCTHCNARTSMEVVLREYEPAGYSCDHCGGNVWVNLDDLLDAKGQRLISHRPVESPPRDPDMD